MVDFFQRLRARCKAIELKMVHPSINRAVVIGVPSRSNLAAIIDSGSELGILPSNSLTPLIRTEHRIQGVEGNGKVPAMVKVS